MRKIFIALVLLLALATTSQAVDATSTYNTLCGTYSFPTAPVGIHTTFAQAYSGGNFTADFSALMAGISNLCGTPVLPPDPDDPVNAKLANW